MQLSQVTDPSLCHGWAGLIQAVRRAGADQSIQLTSHLRHLQGRLADQLHQQGRPVQVGLLDGVAGVSLVHPPETSPPATWWDACLLLDG